jgi:uncharacterized protein YsxB (DUF464 family)
MSSDEEYLDQLLKSINTSDSIKNSDNDSNSDDTIEDQDIGVSDDLQQLLDSLEESEQDDEESFSIEENNTEDPSMFKFDEVENTNQNHETEDLTDLLDLMTEDDELTEISNLLKKNDNESVSDEDMFSFLESNMQDGDGKSDQQSKHEAFDIFADALPENQEMIDVGDELNSLLEAANKAEEENRNKIENEKKEKKNKKDKKNKNAKQDETIDEQAEILDEMLITEELSNIKSKQKKQSGGFFHKIISLLFEEDVTKSSEDIVSLDENDQILKELEEADKKKAKGKKEKKEKKIKEPKQKKEKKEAKAPKVKKIKDSTDQKEVPQKKIPKNTIIFIVLSCATFFVIVMISVNFIPQILDFNRARASFYEEDYEETYFLLFDKKLNESDNIMFRKSSVFLEMQRKIDSYHNYIKMDMPVNALNSLLEGVLKYGELYSTAEELGVQEELNLQFETLESMLLEYQLTTEDAYKILSLSNYRYTLCLEAIAKGEDYKLVMEPVKEEIEPVTFDNILPEEAEMAEETLESINQN